MWKNKPPVTILDPCNFLPFYNISLGRALSERRWLVEIATSEFPFEKIEFPDFLNFKKTFFSGFPAAALLNSKTMGKSTFCRRMIKALTYPLEMLRFNGRLSHRTPGIMHVQWANLPWLDAVFWCLWQRRGWKIVYTAHDPIPLAGTTPRLFSFSGHMLYRRADAIVVHSEYGRREILNLGMESAKISKIHLGPTLISDPVFINRSKACGMLGIPQDTLNILFFGFIKPYKGLDILLRSLSHIRKSFDRVLLIVAGERQDGSSPYEHGIVRSAIKPNIHWSQGFVPSELIPAYFSAADLTVVPYLQGSTSAVIHMSHDFGKPVVATNVGGFSEQMDESFGDRLVSPNDPLSLSQAIIEVLERVKQGSNDSQSDIQLMKRIRNRRAKFANQHMALYLRLWERHCRSGCS